MYDDHMRNGLEIAIIGMACKVPGAKDIHEFWNNLSQGKETISFFTDKELRESGVHPEVLKQPNFVKAKGILGDAEYFDSSFFGYTLKEAEIMDPQLRMFMELCWTALEDSGYNPKEYSQLIGLFAGASDSFWKVRALVTENDEVDPYSKSLLSDKDLLATQIAYRLNLKGPAVTIATACSTSLVAIHLACQSLLSGECYMAVSGGVSISVPEKNGYFYQEGMHQSPDGHNRSFDIKAEGTIFSNGAGSVVLKLLEDAIADNDYIYAIIKSSAINNDGGRKIGFTAPSPNGQAEVIRSAINAAQVEPESISYVETHGTATPIGDPIEVEALKLAFNTEKKGFCAIGSVKSNLGHLDVASGVVGLIKSALALNNRMIPPSLHYYHPNSQIDFDNSPFYVITSLHKWENPKHPLRAGISSFGLGGTNAHVILEEAPRDYVQRPDADDWEYKILTLSARSKKSLDVMTQQLGAHLIANPDINLSDVAYTLQVGRRTFPYRRSVIVSNLDEAKTILVDYIDGQIVPQNLVTTTYHCKKEDKPIIFMFSGQGSQYVDMGRDLYQQKLLFKQNMDKCFTILQKITGEDHQSILYPAKWGQKTAEKKLNQMLYSGPIKFSFEYSLAKLLISWGVKPHYMIGHSFGEYVVACLSGVVALEDVLRLVVVRGRLMNKIAAGAMTSVMLSEEQLLPLLTAGVSLAAVNSPTFCIVSGSVDTVTDFEQKLEARGIDYLRLQVPRAGHSMMLDPILDEYQEAVSQVVFKSPQIPYVSSLTGDWTTEEVTSPGYWVRHLRETVHFLPAVNKLLSKESGIFIEVSPGKSLTLFLNQNPRKQADHLSIKMVRHKEEKMSDMLYTLSKLGELWTYGVPVNWNSLHIFGERKHVSLPTYVFERDRFIIDKDVFQYSAEAISKKELTKEEDIANWFYISTWESSILPFQNTLEYCDNPWLIFLDDQGVGEHLLKKLTTNGYDLIKVYQGEIFSQLDKKAFTINPSVKEDYGTLLTSLAQEKLIPRKILHLWGVTSVVEDLNKDVFAKAQELGYYSLIYLANAIKEQGIHQSIQIDLVTNNMQHVTGLEVLQPEKSTVIGPCIVIPQEYQNITCHSIDIILPDLQSIKGQRLIQQLVKEVTSKTGDYLVAYHGDSRWVRDYKPLHLSSEQSETTLLKEKGVYIITGGLGFVGHELATYLASNYQASLVLVGRTPLPAESEWGSWLSAHSADDFTAQKIKNIQSLKNLGAEVMICSADVTSTEDMAAIIKKVIDKFGEINGVIHAAGVTDQKAFCLLEEITKEKSDQQFAPKVLGMLVLEEVLRDHEIDFCLLISSVSSILGGLAHAPYAAANIFMDMYVKKHNNTSLIPWISVDSDVWNFTGEDEQNAVGAVLNMLAMEPAEGAEAIFRPLTIPNIDQIAISTGDLELRIRDWIKVNQLKEEDEDVEELVEPAILLGRPNLSTEYVPPRNNIEQKIVDIWQHLFGINQIGINDDFFELGGDSLKAITIISKIHKKLKVKLPLAQFFKTRNIRELIKSLNIAASTELEVIPVAELKEYYPLSLQQKKIYIAHEMENTGVGYNVPYSYMIEGEVDKDRIEQSFRTIVHRHEVIRTSFKMNDGQIIQKIHSEVPFSIDYIEVEEKDAREMAENYIRPFDLQQPPLLRVCLIKVAEKRHIMLLDMHHIITDGISISILTKELLELYDGKQLLPLKLQYKDYAEWQNKKLDSEEMLRQENFWLQQFEGEILEVKIPTDYPRPLIQSFVGDKIIFEVSPEHTKKLRRYIREEDASIFMIMFALFNILVSRLSNMEDLVIGTFALGRRHDELENLIGMFVNTLPLRNHPTGDKTFQEFLQEVKNNSIEAFENQEYQFDNLYEKINYKKPSVRHTLNNLAFTWHNVEQINVKMPTISVKSYELIHRSSVFDMTFIGLDTKNTIVFEVEYNTQLFKRERIERFIKYFKVIIQAVIANKEIKLKDIKISHSLLKAEANVEEMDFGF